MLRDVQPRLSMPVGYNEAFLTRETVFMYVVVIQLISSFSDVCILSPPRCPAHIPTYLHAPVLSPPPQHHVHIPSSAVSPRSSITLSPIIRVNQ
jgi:hypothetical protein